MSSCPVGPNFLAYLHKDIAALGAKDIAVIWNNKIDRFQVYQVTPKQGLVDIDGYKRYQPRLIFTVQEKNGDYRPLDHRTLDMIAKSIEIAHNIWDHPEEKRMEMLEKYEAGIYEKKREDARQKMIEQIRDIKPYLQRKLSGNPNKRYHVNSFNPLSKS